MVETQVSVSIKALGPPMRVLTHPGCMAMIRIPVSLRSTERLFIAIFNPLLLHLQITEKWGHAPWTFARWEKERVASGLASLVYKFLKLFTGGAL